MKSCEAKRLDLRIGYKALTRYKAYDKTNLTSVFLMVPSARMVEW